MRQGQGAAGDEEVQPGEQGQVCGALLWVVNIAYQPCKQTTWRQHWS